MAERAMNRAAAAEKTVADLREIVTDQTGLIRQLTAGAASAAGLITDLGARFDRELAACDEAAQAAVRRLDNEFTATVARIESGVSEIITAQADHVRATSEKVAKIRSTLPQSLIIDHAGDLLATLQNGDVERVGPVRGAPGKDAPSIKEATVSNGHLVFKMTNGTAVLAELPGLAPPPEPAIAATARTADGDRVKEAIRIGILMNRNTGEAYAAIGQKFGVTARVVSRIIGEYEDAKNRPANG